KCKNYILGGDLNALTKQLGCLGENQNGTVLEKIINELDFSVINDKTPTFNIFNREYFEILDLSHPQHFLVASAGTIDEQNETITKKILSAAQKSIPFQSQKVFKSSLPPFIVDLIKEHGEKPPIKLKGEAACGPDLIHNLISFQS
ncbi:hypothetical protein BpHYR1_031361, partial [Brachionus plicatilis]